MGNVSKQDTEELWRDLATKAQAGDKRSYNQLLSDIYPYISGVVYNKLTNQDAAEEVAQEVLISIHKSLNTYSPERAFKPWLNAIISYRSIDYLRKHYANKSFGVENLEGVAAAKNHVTDSPFAGELKDIEAALSALPDKQREVFSMIKIEGYSAKEVSKKTGMSVPAVKVSVHRTLKKIKDMMDYDEERPKKAHR